MKRCPTCKKTFTDQKLSYCLDDGTPLVEIVDDEEEPTQVGTDTSWVSPAYRAPSYVPPGGGPGPRRAWPWLAAVIGLLLILMVGFTIAAVVYLPRLKKQASQVVEPKDNSSTNSTTNNNSNSGENASEQNANESVPSNSPAPTDKDVVLAQLTDLEHEWTVANINADKKKLGNILADDYAGPGSDGRIQGKAEYINTVQREPSIQKWEFNDLRLTLHGDRATLLGKVIFQLKDREQVLNFVDRFVWRDGRWQATGSETTPADGSSGITNL
jgi:hypothetical protein